MPERLVEVFLGLQHPGAPGNVAFRLRLDGERVVDVDLVPGFLHRGFEKLAEYRRWDTNVVLIPRICVEDPDNHEYGYVLAVEDLYGVEPPRKAKVVRPIIAEMSRMASHLMWLHFMGHGVGARFVGSWSFSAREEILKWFDYVTGHRVYHHYMAPGGIRWNIPKDFKERTIKVLNFVESIVDDIVKAFVENPITVMRTRGLGKLSPQEAIELGATGPVLRASGLRYDMRKVKPYDAYSEVDFEIPTGKYGDAYDRILVRVEEIRQSIRIIRQLLDMVSYEEMPYRYQLPPKAPDGEGLARVEAARGEYLVHIVSVGKIPTKVRVIGTGGLTPYRIRLRTPSMPFLTTVLKHIVRKEEITIADFPVLVKSLDPCPPDIDR